MILDDDKQILEQTEALTIAQKCIDVFIDNFTIDRDLDRDLSNSSSVRNQYWGVGKYDINKVRSFYISKESKFRKDLKKAIQGLHVSISKDFSTSYRDAIHYRFYYNSQFIFTLDLIFSGKAIQYNTYAELCYSVDTDNELVRHVINSSHNDTQLSKILK